jgi:ADP-ribosylglycohydrolase
VTRALLALDGLSVGDGFGERFFDDPRIARGRVEGRHEPPAPWFWTDDTAMAVSVTRCLCEHGQIDRNDLAIKFSEEYRRDPRRGYGGMAHEILRKIGAGVPWPKASGEAFGGEGSMGNGGAMRVGPVGAWFAEDYARAAAEARASAEVTHAHPEGQAGAIAIAVAAAWAATRGREAGAEGSEMIETALRLTPEGRTNDGIRIALTIPFERSIGAAVAALGNGSQVTAPDTVPFALWCAARHFRNYTEAIWTTVSAYGDIDTNCAIVGGIVALSAKQGIPKDWLAAREALPEIV